MQRGAPSLGTRSDHSKCKILVQARKLPCLPVAHVKLERNATHPCRADYWQWMLRAPTSIRRSLPRLASARLIGVDSPFRFVPSRKKKFLLFGHSCLAPSPLTKKLFNSFGPVSLTASLIPDRPSNASHHRAFANRSGIFERKIVIITSQKKKIYDPPQDQHH